MILRIMEAQKVPSKSRFLNIHTQVHFNDFSKHGAGGKEILKPSQGLGKKGGLQRKNTTYAKDKFSLYHLLLNPLSPAPFH